MVCPKGSECTFNSSLGDPICICMRECKPHQRPVCGSDGVVYDNHCELHRAACINKIHITVVQDSQCVKPTPELIGGQPEVYEDKPEVDDAESKPVEDEPESDEIDPEVDVEELEVKDKDQAVDEKVSELTEDKPIDEDDLDEADVTLKEETDEPVVEGLLLIIQLIL